MKYQSAIISFLSKGLRAYVSWLTNIPSYFRPKRSYKDISYGPEDWQKLDVFTPLDRKRKFETVIFFHGGGWKSGKKEEYRFVADFFIANGFAIVIPNYAKYPQGKFPEFVHDGAAAMDWIKNNSNDFNIDASKIHLAGFSAGAQIAGLLNYNKSYLEKVGFEKQNIKSFIGIAGPYVFQPSKKKLKLIFEDSDNYNEINIPSFVEGNECPALLLHGKKDDIVPYNCTSKLEESILGKSGDVKTIIYDNLAHLSLLGCFASIFSSKSRVKKDILDFIKSI